MYLKSKIKSILKGLSKRISDEMLYDNKKFSREDVRQMIDSYIGKFGENIKLGELNFLNIDTNLLELKQDINALKVKKYRDFPVHSVKNRIANIVFNYGDYEYSKQERKDLLEVSEYFLNIRPSNQQFFEEFQNKDNSLYKWLLRLDNIQRHERYNKDRFQYNPHFINTAFTESVSSGDMYYGSLVKMVPQIISKDGGWNKTYSTFEGNQKPIRTKTGNTIWALLGIQRKIKNKKNNYLRNYRRDRMIISKGDLLLSFRTDIHVKAGPSKELITILASSYKYYLNEFMRIAASRMLMGDILTEDTSVTVDYDSIKEKLTGYKYALDMQETLIPNWFGRTIMHSIKHANMTKGPDNNIYIK